MKKRSCTAFLAACALAVFAGAARGEDEADEQKVTVSLAEVRAFPEAYRRVSFDVELLYHGPRSIYNPFFTVFEPSNYANFAAWSGDAAIFRRDEYCDDHPLFYVERRNQALQRQMMSLRPYTWMVARCIVRGVAQDKAWIEVLSIPTIGATLDPVDLRHLVRGHALGQSGEIERAMVELGMARLFQVPPRFVARCRLEEGRLALAGNQPERALVALQQAWTQLPEDKQLTKLIDRASAQVAMLRQGEISGTPATTPPPAAPDQKPANGDGQTPAWTPQADGPAAPKSTTPAESAVPAKDPAKEATPAWTPKDEAQPATPKSTTPAEPQAPAKESNPEWSPKDDAAPATPKSTTPPAEAPAQNPTQEPWVPADPAAPPAAKPAESKPAETPAQKPTQEPWVPADPAAPPAAKPTDSPAEKPADKPADAPSEKPADKPTETPAEKPADKPVDAPSEKPVEAPPADEPVGEPSDDEVPPPVTPDPSDDGDDGSDGG